MLKPMSRTNIILVSLNLVVLVFIGGLTFWWWRSNQPEAIYNRGMYSIGKALQKISEPDNLEKLANYRFAGNLTVTTPDSSFQTESQAVNKACKFDDELGFETSLARDTISGHIQAETSLNQSLSARIRLINQAGSLPGLYFYLEPGDCLEAIMAEFGDDPDLVDWFGPNAALAGIWWYLDPEEFFDLDEVGNWQAGLSELDQGVTSYSQVASQQAVILSRYLFTDNPDDMIIQRDKLIAKNVDFRGSSTNHYSAKLNYVNLKKMVSENSLALEELIDPAALDDWRAATNDILTEIDRAGGQESNGPPLEVWVDTNTKILRNLRMSNPDNKDEYIQLEFLLRDDVFSIRLDYNLLDIPDLDLMQVSFDTKTQAVDLQIEMTESDYTISLRLQSVINDTDLRIDIPKDYRRIE